MNARTSRPQALFAALVALTLLAPGAPAQEGPKTQYPYGFRGFEMYKLDPGISELTACDADGDGLQDLLVVNNAKAKIEVLLRRKEPVPPKTKAGKKLPNDLVDDRFYERRDILTEKKVIALEAADFNGDGKADVAYYGKPEELVLAYGDGKGGFGETQSFRLEDYNESPRGLAAGDLNGDGRTDLVLLAKGYTRLYYQSAKGSLQEPAKVPHAVKGVSGILVRDLDGDGRVDLVHLAPSARFQAADGSLGAEVAFEISPWRELEFHDLDAAPGAELIVVQRASGILRSLKMTRKPSEAGSEVALGSPQIHAFEPSQGNKARAMAIGDVNGDGRADIVVTEPGTAQVALYLQDEKGELAGRKTFPSLSNSESLRLADLSGDGRAEVVVLSSGERAVGVCALTAEGRLPFPKMLAVPGVPKSMDTGDLNGDGRADLVVVVEKDKKRRAMLFLQKADGGLGDEPVTLELEGLKNAPDDMLIMDLDQDGRTDILLFDRYGPMRV
ncbi:MAG: FG-GAP repeat domain-containing protein, partial [Planctomycetota bacterium]